MTKAAKIGIVVALAAIAVAAIAARTPKYSRYDQYVCTACGLKRTEYEQRVGPITYQRQITLQESPISQALKIKNCPHTWLRYRFGRDSGFLLGGWRAFVDGGSRSYMLQELLADEAFAADLARMEHPSSVLKDMFVCLNDSRELDEALGSWWYEPDRGNFSGWWKTHEQMVHAILVSTNR